MNLSIPGREVERIDRAYLFSHLNSRAGSTLVVHKNLSRALARDQDDGFELLEAYREEGGYGWGVVQARWFECSRGRWSGWEDTAFALLWEGDVPDLLASAGPPREELRVDPRDVGEDAWGLALIWSTGTR